MGIEPVEEDIEILTTASHTKQNEICVKEAGIDLTSSHEQAHRRRRPEATIAAAILRDVGKTSSRCGTRAP
eukprot:9485687-Pyramimonas_sp.AAC.1